jgi:predicted acylesterase/phospholipase RssA
MVCVLTLRISPFFHLGLRTLKGGVALGAYEAGVFHALVKKLSEQDEDKGKQGFEKQKRPLFDIVAGTSIGGMNAAVVVSSIRRGDS